VDQDGDHAETYLRLLAEAALRASAHKPPGVASSLDGAARAHRAADILVDAGVLDDARAEEILLMLSAALHVRGHRGWQAPGGGRVMRIGAITAPGSRAPQPGTAAQRHHPWRVSHDFPGQVRGSKLMALIVTGDRMIAPATLAFPPSAGLTDLAAPSFADLEASDDTSASYQVSFTHGAWAGSTWTGTVLLRPPPSPRARLLTITGPNGPVLRAQLSPDPPAREPRAAVAPLAESPGERLLIRRAEAMLGALALPGAPGWHIDPAGPGLRRPGGPQVMRVVTPGFPGTLPPSPVTPAAGPSPLALAYSVTEERGPGLEEVIAVLEGARVLSPLSPVPARVAALSMALGGTALGGTALGGPASRQAGKLPSRWHEVLAYYGRRGHRQPSSGTGSIGATLPEVDGALFAVAGVHAGRTGTVLHVIGRGFIPGPRVRQDMRFSWWARDEDGSWHLAIAQAWHPANEDVTVRLILLPPLSPGGPGSTSTLTLEITGPASQLTADLTVRW
jgi:hypothetical protein